MDAFWDDFGARALYTAVRRRNGRTPLRTTSYSSGGDGGHDLARLWAAGARRIEPAEPVASPGPFFLVARVGCRKGRNMHMYIFNMSISTHIWDDFF